MGGTLTRAAVAGAAAAVAFAYAFSHPGGAAADHGECHAPNRGFDFDTLELEHSVLDYGRAIELAVAGKAVAFSYQLATGEPVDVRYQGLLAGPRADRTAAPDPALSIPPTVYKSIAWIEAAWNNAAGSVPYGGVGPVIQSYDCGYGLGQVTSGMSHTYAPPALAPGVPSARQATIGTHFLFNIAEGVRILADKWNSAPRYRPIAGTGDPAALEDWYFAIWSYNGFAFSNHPLNPDRDPLRGDVYHCENETAPGYGMFFYSSYTYPERVYGCMRYPPARDARPMWAAQAFLMPALTREPVSAAFNPKNFLDCQEAGFSGTATACRAMDFPTALPDDPATKVDDSTRTHADTTAPPDPKWASTYLGAPVLSVVGPTAATLNAYADGTASSTSITVRNTGKWIAPFRVRSSVPWLVARHPGDATTVSIDGGVAIGAETKVVLESAKKVSLNIYVKDEPILTAQATIITVNSSASMDPGDTFVIDDEHVLVTAVPSLTQVAVLRGQDGTTALSHTFGTPVMWLKPAKTQPGYQSQLVVTLVSSLVPPGGATARIWVEPLYGSGPVFEMVVEAVKAGTPEPLKYRVHAPGLAAE
ncbi:MAG: hypothetical protein HY875_00590 [Chloroflexi bacterium]|nr:hypothetical protein [Chloroflexota bacterium]